MRGGPRERYRREIERGDLRPDAEQAQVVDRLERIASELARRRPWRRPSRSVFARWLPQREPEVTGVRGLYLWGGVGRGKTHLCDLFFDGLPFADKRRLHFHRFMQRIHADLRALGHVEEPLPRIADEWAERARLLLLDEIHVNDITDAMLLGGLLTALFRRGVTLVTTSNVAPGELYRDGLQRARFLPAIAQIKRHTKVIEMRGEEDYRLSLMQSEPIYLVGEREADGRMDEGTREAMSAHFRRLAPHVAPRPSTLAVNGRDIPARALAADLAWFDFATLCATPRSTADYAAIADEFRTLMLSAVPVMSKDQDDEARRFVNLVDELYDRRVKLVVSAEAGADALYRGERLAFEFRRAASRLIEMRTREYLASGRRPRDAAA